MTPSRSMHALFGGLLIATLCLAAGSGSAQTIGHALNNPGKTFTSADTPWVTDGSVTHDGVSSGRSALITQNQTSSTATSFTGPGTLNFWWKVIAKFGDVGSLRIDGAEVLRVNPLQPWMLVSYELSAGEHTVEWRFSKYAAISSLGEGLFVDEVALFPVPGDVDRHIDARVRTAALSGSTLVFNEPGAIDRFKARTVVDLQRLDEVTVPATAIALALNIAWSLEDMHTGAPVGVESGEHLFSVSLASWHGRGSVASPSTAVLDETFSVGGSAPLDINPEWTYRLTLVVSYTDLDGNGVTINSSEFNNLRLATFSGRLTAGPVEARFNSTDWNPATVVPSGDGLGHTFTVVSAPNTAWFADNPTSRFRFNLNTVYRDLATGDLTLRGGVPIPLPGFAGTIANVCYRIENSTLSDAGLNGGSMKVCLPAGTGVTTSPTARLLESEIDLGAVPITSAGLPDFSTQVYVPVPPRPVHIVHEQTPIRYVGSQLLWDVAAGTFTMSGATPVYLRERETTWLEADALAGDLTDPSTARKSSNESPWQRTVPTPTDLVIAVAPGGVGVLTASIALGGAPRVVSIHSPLGIFLPLDGESSIQVTQGAFTADSTVGLSGPVVVGYSPNSSKDAECGVARAKVGILSMTTTDGTLVMTADGGWRGAGMLPAGSTLDWGGLHALPGAAPTLPTHRLENLGSVSLLVAGTYLEGNYNAVPDNSRAAALLLSGLGTPENYTLVERPHTVQFNEGLVDYPGLNVRISDGVPVARSFLAQHALGPYSLKPYSKYYVTYSGVSGIHDAVTRTLPSPILLYGYDSMLDGLRLTYLDNDNKESATAGHIKLPGPSDFEVSFSKLRFTPGGGLADAELPPDSPEVTLKYWQCTLKPELLEFTPPSPEVCTGTNISYLTLSGRVGLGTISGTPVRGSLAFKADGSLIKPEDKLVRGVDSSLPMPPGFALKARGTLTYPFAAATRLRFNAWAPNPQPANGFLFVAGKLNVPFFEDLPVLLHLEPANYLEQAHVMGGWRSDPSQVEHGWINLAGKTFFTSTDFDAGNRGYPSNVTVKAYRAGLPDQTYRPHVRKDWLRIVNLEFPVQWNAVSREFLPAGNQDMDLLVLEAQGQVKGLDAVGAEIEFGARFVGLPNLNSQGFARALTDAGSLLPDSPEKKLANALTGALSTAISQPLIRAGTEALDHLLDDSLANLLDTPLRAGLDAPLNSLHAALRTQYAATGMTPGPLNGVAEVQQLKDALTAHLRNDLLAAENVPTSLIAALETRLKQAYDALGELEQLCNPDQLAVDGPPVVNPGNQNNPFLQAIARRALEEFLKSDFTTTGSNDAQNAVRKLLKDLIEDARPILRQVNASIIESRRALQDMLASLQGGGGGSRNLHEQMRQALQDSGAAQAFAEATVNAFITQITNSRDVSGRWFDEVSPGQLNERFGSLLVDRFHASPLEQSLKQSLKRLLDPVRQTAHNALNMVFGQVNNMVNQVALVLVKDFKDKLAGYGPEVAKAFGELLGNGGDAFQAAVGGLGDFGNRYDSPTKVIQFAKAQGYARTRGDSLDELRLEASIGLSIPDEIGASVFVLIKNVQSDVPSTSCRDPGAVATEVTIGANGGVTMKKSQTDTPKAFKARLEGRFSFPPGNGFRVPNGLDGLVDFETEIDLGALTLKEVRLRMGLGGTEAYATAAARGSVWFVEGEARLFLGATKQLSILRGSFHPDIFDTIITQPKLPLSSANCLANPIIGIYGSLGAYISVNRFFGIPDSPFLTLKAGRSLSEYVLISDGDRLSAGIRDALSVTGKVLLVGVSAEAALLFNANVDAAKLAKAEGIGSVLASISGTAQASVKGCADFYIDTVCHEATIIVGLKLNPPSFYPIRIKF